MKINELKNKVLNLDTKTVTDNGIKFSKNMAYPLLAVVAFHVFEGDIGMGAVTLPIEWLLGLLQGNV